ncbi:MAG TPA: SDR family oxidoreductase [Rubricoccaceae bacterium]|nr:SDR family oxidoreductase [Rubricoccaceae bacterium]
MTDPKTALIVGATSAIAHETARRFAAEGAALFLAARSPEKLEAVAADLRARGAARVETAPFDADGLSAQDTLVEAVCGAFPDGLDVALVAYGTLPDQPAMEADADAAAAAFQTNATSVIALLTRLANLMEKQGRGTLGVISSVAGDRGRPSNYVYGAAKGAVSLFSQGLRARLSKKGVRVVTIKPGFVDTPMTAHLPKNALFADPADVGAKVHRALTKGGDVVYVPGFWRPIMAAVRAVPERVFKRLKL